jgi:hypothetical protein
MVETFKLLLQDITEWVKREFASMNFGGILTQFLHAFKLSIQK